MIFYFSGTGNSLYAAKRIAEHNKEELVSISAVINRGSKFYEFTLKDNEIIGFVYPIYAWGPPRIVLDFIQRLKLINYRDNYTFTVATCGGSIGNTLKVMNDCLKEKDIKLNGGFSVVMPNNYIIMGDVDSKEKIKEKIVAADKTLKNINDIIGQRKSEMIGAEKGFFPWLLTGFVNPMFNKKKMDTTKFHANDKCTKCGICEKVCNCNNIKVNEKPQWEKNCVQCLACIHYCPSRAIQYGKNTEKKGRYTNPYIKINE